MRLLKLGKTKAVVITVERYYIQSNKREYQVYVG